MKQSLDQPISRSGGHWLPIACRQMVSVVWRLAPVLRNASAVVVVTFVFAGCDQPPAVNPWRDDSIPASSYGTASSEAVLAANAAPAVRTRQDMPLSQAPGASGAVPHYPLWWEDPFEDQGDKDAQFAVTWQDYFDMPYGLARFMLNTMGWPASAVVTLPGTPMVSDGVVGKVHDARRGQAPNPTASIEDFDLMAQAAPAPAAEPVAAPSTAPGS